LRSTPRPALGRSNAPSRVLRPHDASPLWISSGGEQVELEPELTESTGPTDKGSRRRPRRTDPEDAATDEVPSLLRLAPELPPAVSAPDSLPPLRLDPEEIAVVAAPRANDEPSTGLFESWDWDEADPYTTGEYPCVPAGPVDLAAEPTPEDPYLSRASRSSATRDVAWEREMTGPRLAVVRQAPVEEEYGDLRAQPLPVPPRPVPDAASGGPLRAFRPAPAEVPDDWLGDDRQDTMVVIDPTLRPPGRPWIAVALLDASAWAVGFAATFLAGVVTSASAGAVALVLTR
jgi:hypothetical protein